MPDYINILYQYVDYFPLVALAGLLLAGLNLPISEDLIIITGAIVCHKKPSLLPFTLAALYFGVLSSDFFIYWIGTKVRKGTGKTRFFKRLFSEKALEKMHHYLDKYGIFTFIVCRFIPFGIRNTLFFASGFFNLRLRRFIINDVSAAMISINTLFFLVFSFGDIVEKPIKIAGIILFVVLVSAVLSIIIRVIVARRKKERNIIGS